MAKTDLNLYHYSEESFEYDSSKTYFFSENMKKAYGLWLSVEDSWSIWCKTEDFGLDRLKTKSKFSIDMENIAHMRNEKEVGAFASKYCTGEHSINWLRVSKEFKGFLVYPYIEEFKSGEEYHWYSLLDCPSACIWDLSCIKLVD